MPESQLSNQAEDWDVLGGWLQSRVGPSDRRYRYAMAYASLLAGGGQPTNRQRHQAKLIWNAATQDGFWLDAPSAVSDAEVALGSGPRALDTMIPDLGAALEIPQETRWANLSVALEGAIATLPENAWFALWLASDRGVPHNDRHSYSAEVRLDAESIRLRCIGPHHLEQAAQLPGDAQARLRELGWSEHQDRRRLLRQPDIGRDDAGAADAARRTVDLMRQVYGAEDPGDLYVEVRDALRPIALGLFGGLTVLPPEHFDVEVAGGGQTSGSRPAHRDATSQHDRHSVPRSGPGRAAVKWEDQLPVRWCADRLGGAVEVAWQPSDEFDLHVEGRRPSPHGGIDPVVLDMGDGGIVLSISWPAVGSRMNPPPMSAVRRSVENRNAVLDRQRQLTYRFRRDMRFGGAIFEGVSLFSVVPRSDVSARELNRKFDVLAEAADALVGEELWEMGVWRPRLT